VQLVGGAVGTRSISKNSLEHPNPNIKSANDQLWYNFHNFWPVQVPLSMQMPGTPRAEEGVAAKEPVTQLSKLSNGVRLITESSWGLGASMAIFFDTGSRVETPMTQGCSHFLQHLAFKASVDKSHFMMTREIELLGGHVAAGAGRDCIMYAGECLSADAPALLELMAETALKPRLEKIDVDNVRALVLNDNQNQMKNGERAYTLWTCREHCVDELTLPGWPLLWRQELGLCTSCSTWLHFRVSISLT
jgi:hypothetical protein